MSELIVKPHERVDDLQRNGLRIIQDPKAFRFGMDAVLLADFTRVRPRERVVDMGAGTGILSLLLSQKELTASFDAFELQPDMADMAQRSVRMNGLEARIHVHAQDMRTAAKALGPECADAVVCNPPYGKQGSTLQNEAAPVLLARHETDCSIHEVAAACAAVLRTHGRASFVFPAQRILELCDALRAVRLEPKRMRMVCARVDRAPYLVLLEAMKNAKPSVLWLPPLVVYNADGSETQELRHIYHND